MAQNLTEDDVRKIAKLARVRLTDREASDAVSYLSEVTGYVDMLQRVATEHIEPYSPLPRTLSELRDDAVVHFSNRKGLIGGSNFNKDGLLVTQGIFTTPDPDDR